MATVLATSRQYVLAPEPFRGWHVLIPIDPDGPNSFCYSFYHFQSTSPNLQIYFVHIIRWNSVTSKMQDLPIQKYLKTVLADIGRNWHVLARCSQYSCQYLDQCMDEFSRAVFWCNKKNATFTSRVMHGFRHPLLFVWKSRHCASIWASLSRLPPEAILFLRS